MDNDRLNNHIASGQGIANRRRFLKNGVILGTVTGLAGLNLITGCSKEKGEEISPAEDLMREHGLLNRILLIYDNCSAKLTTGEQFPMDALINSAMIIRSFIEDYHEKLEEDFLFPRFIKANHLTELVTVLQQQHKAGRQITDQIISIGKMPVLEAPAERQKLTGLLSLFNRMYRPHEAREDTVLFPEMRKIISPEEYFELGESFEDMEHELFGEEGFESNVQKVEEIEKLVGIYELSAFTPVIMD